METIKQHITLRWADLDPNFHVLHSKYYDFAATARMEYMLLKGLSIKEMLSQHFGPIIFREEAAFKREIIFGDKVHTEIALKSLSADYRKWTIETHIIKNETELAAIVTVDGAWMDTKLRKVIPLPEGFRKIMDEAPKANDFAIT
jgi:acyl-CoA thioester hydrolase